MEEKDKANDNTKKVGGIVGVITFIIVFIIMMVCLNMGDSSNSDPDTNTPQTYYHAIGEKITYEGLEVTIKSYDYTKEFGGAYVASSSDNSFCIVNVELKNVTSSKIYLIDQIFTYTSHEYVYKLIYDEDIEYLSEWLNYDEFLNTHEEISPLETILAALCYEIPNEVKNSSKNLEIKFSKNKTEAPEYHIWKLR